MKKLVYLDNNATTEISLKVQKAIKASLGIYGNPSSLHFYGVATSEKVQQARATIAQSIGASSDEIVFTGSGSEGNNLCIRGYAEANRVKGKHIITTVIEHPSVINSCKHLEEQGFTLTYLGVDGEGFIDLRELENAITEETILISVGHANNEIGTIQDIQGIVAVADRHGIPVHLDAVQSFLKMPFDVRGSGISLATFSGHKFHAPKGVGFIYKKKGLKLRRQIDGGAQEFNLRAGTENPPYIIGLAEAVARISSNDILRMRKLQAYLLDKVISLKGVRINGPRDLERRLCTNLNFSFENLEAENLLNRLSEKGICVSTGSACSSKSTKVSPVLLAIGCPVEYIHGNLRISISKYTTKGELDYFVRHLVSILNDSSSRHIHER